MNILKTLPLVGIFVAALGPACLKQNGSGDEEESEIFNGSNDVQANSDDSPISPKVETIEVILAADATEVKNEAPQDLPVGNNQPGFPPFGTPGDPRQTPAPTPSNPSPSAPAPFFPAHCAAIKAAQPTAGSGVYKIYLNPTTPTRVALDAYCEMSVDGGGWTLMLNYVHKAQSNPPLTIKTESLPVLVGDTLGSDESALAKAWGHAANALFSQFPAKEMRFYCRSSQSERIVHFKSSDPGCLGAAKTGMGTCLGIKDSFAALDGHTANIPAILEISRSNAGDLALTDDVFGRERAGDDDMWSIGGTGDADTWECDSGSNNAEADTIHRIFFR